MRFGSHPFFFLARLKSPFWSRTFPDSILTSIAQTPAYPSPTPNLVPEVGRRSFPLLSNYIASFAQHQCKDFLLLPSGPAAGEQGRNHLGNVAPPSRVQLRNSTSLRWPGHLGDGVSDCTPHPQCAPDSPDTCLSVSTSGKEMFIMIW